MNWLQNGLICHRGGPIMMFLFWGLLILGIIWVVRNINIGQNNSDKDEAKKIARIRYAEGEINKEELEEILNNISD